MLSKTKTRNFLMTDGSATVRRVLATLAWEMGETAIKSYHAMQCNI